MSSRRLYYEKGSRIFQENGKNANNTLWGTWIVRIDKGNRQSFLVDGTWKNCTVVPSWRSTQDMKIPSKKKRPRGSPQHISSVEKSNFTSLQKPKMLDLFSGTGSVGKVLLNEALKLCLSTLTDISSQQLSQMSSHGTTSLSSDQDILMWCSAHHHVPNLVGPKPLHHGISNKEMLWSKNPWK